MEFGGQGVSEKSGYISIRWLYIREAVTLVWRRLVDALSSFFFCYVVLLLLMDVDTPCYDT